MNYPEGDRYALGWMSWGKQSAANAAHLATNARPAAAAATRRKAVGLTGVSVGYTGTDEGFRDVFRDVSRLFSD